MNELSWEMCGVFASRLTRERQRTWHRKGHVEGGTWVGEGEFRGLWGSGPSCKTECEGAGAAEAVRRGWDDLTCFVKECVLVLPHELAAFRFGFVMT